MNKSEMLSHIADLSEDNMRLRHWLSLIKNLSLEDLSTEELENPNLNLMCRVKSYADAALSGLQVVNI